MEKHAASSGGKKIAITASQIQGFKMAKNCGIFWPLKLWNARCVAKGQPELQTKKKEMELPGEGPGVIRDEAEFGHPMETIRLTDEMMRLIKRDKDVHEAYAEDAEGVEASDNPTGFAD